MTNINDCAHGLAPARKKIDSSTYNYIKVLNTDRRWGEGTCLLICINFRPKNILIIIYQWPISQGRQYR